MHGWWWSVVGGGRENEIALCVEESTEHGGAVGTFDFLINNAHP